MIHPCRACKIALWSRYSGGPGLSFIRVGALDDPAALPPEVHIYTRSELPRVTLPADIPAFESFTIARALWPAQGLERRKAILG